MAEFKTYACYKNAKKLGEYVKGTHNITFTATNHATLDESIDMSITICKYFKMPVSLVFDDLTINIPYDEHDSINVKEIMSWYKQIKKGAR